MKNSQVVTYNPYRVQARPDGIGAFAVTAEDGTTYHYSLPVQQNTQHSSAFNVPYGRKHRDDNEDGVSHSITGEKGPDATHRGPRVSYAAAWLLTAVTSADYVDRNQNGVVDSSDWGDGSHCNTGAFRPVTNGGSRTSVGWSQ